MSRYIKYGSGKAVHLLGYMPLTARLCSTLAKAARRPESLQNSEIIPNFVRVFEYIISS